MEISGGNSFYEENPTTSPDGLPAVGKMKVFVWGFVDDDGAAIVNSLGEHLDVVYWVATAPESQNIWTYVNGHALPYQLRANAIAAYHTFYRDNFLQYQILITRRGLFHSDLHGLGNEFARNYYHFYELLRYYKPEIVIFASLPHEGSDFILYKLARTLGIKTLACYQTLFSNRFLLTTSLEDFGRFSTIPPLFDDGVIKIEQSFVQELFYMQDTLMRHEWSWLRKQYALVKTVLRFLIKTSFRNKLALIKNWVRPSIAKRRERAYIKDLNQRAASDLPATILDRRNIYVPLHLQPELTTATLGGVWQDQAHMLEALSTLLDGQWNILVKENPKQTYFQRDAGFFERMSKTPGMVLLNKVVPTIDLLERAECVATVTGTAGWEAVKGGRKCLVFGQAWYSTLQGVLQFSTALTTADFSDFLAQPQSFEEFLTSFRKLERKMGFGVTDSAYNEIVGDYSAAQNAETVVRSLLAVINSPETVWN